MLYDDVLGLVTQYLRELAQAVYLMKSNLWPPVPLPTPRTFVLWRTPGPNYHVFRWPAEGRFDVLRWERWDGTMHGYSLHFGDERTLFAQGLLRATEGNPRRIAAVLRNIQAATAWCHARYAGRLRHREELLRQQRKWVDELGAAYAVRALGEGR